MWVGGTQVSQAIQLGAAEARGASGVVTRRIFVLGSVATAALVQASLRSERASGGAMSERDMRTLVLLGELALVTTLGQGFLAAPAGIHIGADTGRLREVVTGLGREERQQVAAGADWFRHHMTLHRPDSFLGQRSRLAEVGGSARGNLDLAASAAIVGVATKFAAGVDPSVGRLWIDGLVLQGRRDGTAP
jgi:hypothetical protein